MPQNILPDDSSCNYNGFQFGLYTRTDSIEGKAHWDSAGRTITYIVYSITITTKITADQLDDPEYDTGDQMEAIRRQLQSPAGTLIYTNKGFGDFSINTKGSPKDVVWGPKPQVLKWKPVGGPAACEITWTVEVAVPECQGAKFSGFLMEFCYSLGIKMDKSGYTTRTYSGHISIPQTRATQSSRKLTDTADNYREQIYPKPIPGFRRLGGGDYELSEDKCTETFTIVDEEMAPNIPPAGVVDCEASHVVSSTDSLMNWNQTFTGSYEMGKDQPRGGAYNLFRAMVDDRLAVTKKFAETKPKGVALMPIAMTFSEPEIYGRKCAAFSATFRTVTSIVGILKATGLWRATPGSDDWQSWSQSLKDTAFNVRGWAGMTFDPSQDVIIDLCQPVKTGAIPGIGGINLKKQPTSPTAAADKVTLETDTSWINFENNIYIETREQRVMIRPLPKSATDVPTAMVQQRAATWYEAIMEGQAMRLGYPIGEPSIVSVGGVPAVRINEKGQGFKSAIIGNYGQPVYGAVWKIRYTLTKMPTGTIAVPPNTLFNAPQPGAEAVNAVLGVFGIQPINIPTP